MKRNRMSLGPVLAAVVLQIVISFTPAYGETDPRDVLARLAESIGIKKSDSIESVDDIKKRLTNIVALSKANDKLQTWVKKRQDADDRVKQKQKNLDTVEDIKKASAQIEQKKIKDIDNAVAGLQPKPNFAKGQIDQSNIEDGCPTENLNPYIQASEALNTTGVQKFLAKVADMRADFDEEAAKQEIAAITEKIKEDKKKIADNRLAKGDFAAIQKQLKEVAEKGGQNVTDINKTVAALTTQTEGLTAKGDELEDKLPEAIGKMLTDVAKARTDKKKVAQVAGEFADYFAGATESIKNIAKQHIRDTRKACKKAEKQIQPLVDEVYSLARAQQLSLSEVDQAASEIDVDCSGMSEGDADNFGNNAFTAINAMRSQGNLPALINNVKGVIEGITANANNLTIQLNSVSQKCSQTVREKNSVKKKRDEMRGGGEEGGSPAPQKRSFSRGRGGRGGRGAGGNRTH